MKILHIAEIHSRVNGIKDVVFHLADNQKKLSNDVHIFSIANDDDVQNTDMLLKLYGNIHFYHCVKKLMPDIVILHSLYKWPYLCFSLILRGLGIPYLIEAHGAMSKANQQKSKWKKRIVNFLFFRQFIRRSAGIVYLCKEEKESSIFVNDTNSLIIPNAINLPPSLNIKYINHDEHIKIIFLGRFDILHKGLDVLVEAIGIMHDALIRNHTKILFYGYGDGDKILRKSISQYQDVSEVCGPVYGDDKALAYENGNIFILTSRYEGFPIAILEALSYGLPCIVTPQTNVSTLIQKNCAGWVTELSPKCIAQTVLYALEDYRINSLQMQKNAFRVVQDYSWDKIAQESIEKYKNIIKN